MQDLFTMPKPRTRPIKTLADLQQSLSLLWPGAKCSAEQVNVRAHDDRGTSTSKYFRGAIWIGKAQAKTDDSIYVQEEGATLIDVLIKCKRRLAQEIEDLARKRQLGHRPQHVIEHKPRALEFKG